MTLTVSYDSVLSRVQLAATALADVDIATVERSVDQIRWSTCRGGAAIPVGTYAEVTDTFGRTVANGWGSADTGQAWSTSGGSASDYSVGSGVGSVSHAAVSTTHITTVGSGLVDVDVLADVTSPVTAAGGNIEISLIARYQDASNYYKCRLAHDTLGNIDLRLDTVIATVETNIALVNDVVTYTPGTATHVRFSVRGATLRAKVWSGSTEPASWTLEAVAEDNPLASGAAGTHSRLVSSNTNTLPVVVTYDNLAINVYKVLLDDYEFRANMVNYYRVRGVSTDPISLVAAGTGSSGSSGSRTPGKPAGMVAGDLMLCHASTRNVGTGTVDVPAGWTYVGGHPSARVMAKAYDGSESMPTITFTNGAANEDTIARIAAFRNADLTPVALNTSSGGAQQDIPINSVAVPVDKAMALAAGWKQSSWTSVATVAGMTEISEDSSSAGNGAGQVWDYVVQTTKADIASSSFVVTGGVAAVDRAAIMAFAPQSYLNEQTGNVTPTVTAVWLKSVSRPFLNRTVVPAGYQFAYARPGRVGVDDVVARTLPIGVTDLGSSRRFELILRTDTAAEADVLDSILASGDILYLQRPVSGRTAGLPNDAYVAVQTATIGQVTVLDQTRLTSVDLVEVAAPGPDVVPATATWDTLLAVYGTWTDVLAAFPTWSDVLAAIGDPAEVIVA